MYASNMRGMFRNWNIIEPKENFSNVHSDDVPAVKIIQPYMEEGPWIAGGAVLNWYQNSPVGDSDIDVFFHDLRQFDEVFGRLMRNGSTIVYNSDNAVTLNLSLADSNRGYRIQLIRKRWYKTAEEVINSFDFTVCQILTDGDRILFGPTSAEDVKNKLVRHNALKPIQDDVIKRIIKYVCYGYNLDRELSEYIRNNKDTLTWRFNSDQDHYENAF